MRSYLLAHTELVGRLTRACIPQLPTRLALLEHALARLSVAPRAARPHGAPPTGARDRISRAARPSSGRSKLREEKEDSARAFSGWLRSSCIALPCTFIVIHEHDASEQATRREGFARRRAAAWPASPPLALAPLRPSPIRLEAARSPMSGISFKISAPSRPSTASAPPSRPASGAGHRRAAPASARHGDSSDEDGEDADGAYGHGQGSRKRARLDQDGEEVVEFGAGGAKR